MPIGEAARALLDNQISGCPAMEQDQVVGIIASLDLLREFARMFKDN